MKHEMTFDSLLWVLLLSWVGVASTAAKNYSITTLDNGFTVSIGNILIFQHQTTSPILFVGQGQIQYYEFQGNFDIKDYTEERVEMRTFSLTNDSIKDYVKFTNGNYTVRMSLQTTDNHPLVVDFSDEGPSHYGRMWVRIKAESNEKVFGGGEQFSYFNLRGKTFPIWTREQGVGRNASELVTFYSNKQQSGGDYHTTYYPQPTFHSSRLYYCHYSGSNYALLAFDHPEFHEIFVSGKVDRFYFNADSTPLGLVQKLASFLGRQHELPEWIYTGAILGVQGGTDVMLQRLQSAQNSKVPVSGLWIQDWAGVLKTSFGSRLFWNWQWNSTRYPELNSTIADLKKQGIRVLAYINPYLNIEGRIFQGVKDKGYFVMNASGQPYISDFGEFYCATVDFTNPASYDWYKGLIKTNLIGMGLSGWMADFGEYLPASGVKFYNNKSGEVLHNTWPMLWAKLNREAVEETGKLGDVVFWTRAGFSGTHNYSTLMWAGDQDVDFTYADGLPSVIPAALSMGMSGIGITHFDIGGYTTFGALGLRRSPELLLRSAEAAIFTPMFRSHEGNQPQANTQFYSSPEIQSAFGRLAQIYVHISNYTKFLVKKNSKQGIPVQQPLFLAYPDDPIAWSTTYQYMFGRDLLVAPVIATNVSTMNVYLPNDSSVWVYIWNGSEFQGPGYFMVSSEIGKPPAFFRKTSTFRNLFSSVRTKFPYVPFNPNPSTAIPHTSTTPQSAKTSHTSTAKSLALTFHSIYPHLFYIQYFALSIYSFHACI